MDKETNKNFPPRRNVWQIGEICYHIVFPCNAIAIILARTSPKNVSLLTDRKEAEEKKATCRKNKEFLPRVGISLYRHGWCVRALRSPCSGISEDYLLVLEARRHNDGGSGGGGGGGGGGGDGDGDDGGGGDGDGDGDGGDGDGGDGDGGGGGDGGNDGDGGSDGGHRTFTPCRARTSGERQRGEGRGKSRVVGERERD
ncbi:hypothetical protein V1477_002922 [Vespula maculifrons]|uniref:Uncharacterized protein n=1 Tax=Vespula maculifrons TaxID=7453 RepID=A0ABD2CUP6_VESMC